MTLPAETLTEAVNAARRIGYPVALKLYTDAVLHPHQVVLSRLNLRNRAALSRAYGEMLADARAQESLPRPWHLSVQKMVAVPRAREVAIGVSTDPVFGPVIAFGNGGMTAAVETDKAVMLPPLNAKLALDLILGTRAGKFLGTTPKLPAADLDPVVKLLLQLSALVCALPWVRELELNPVQVGARSAAIVDARIVIEPKRRPHGDRYRHMAIHPYPMELVHDVALKDGDEAARPADPARGRRARARIRRRPVRAEPLLPLHAPPAAAHAADARALHAGRLRPRDGAGGRLRRGRRDRVSSGSRATSPIRTRKAPSSPSSSATPGRGAASGRC